MPLGTIAVSGVTGFIGAQVALHLLEAGYTVHGTVRRNVPERLRHLTGHHNASEETLKIFEADLLDDHSFDAAVAGCDAAIHVASPYIMNVTNAEEQLIRPAVEGTRNFLQSCLDNNIRIVVLTSSIAAITDGGEPEGKILTEDDWNTHSSPTFLPYYYSKVAAERTAWSFVENNSISLRVINPVAVYGPSLIPAVGESAGLLCSIARRQFPGLLDISLPIVDVRDVADAHIAALKQDVPKGRYICCPDEPMLHMRDMVRLLKSRGFTPRSLDLTTPTMSWVFRMLGKVVPGAQGQFLQRYCGLVTVTSNEKIRRDTGMSFRPVEETVTETIEDLIKWGHLEDPQSRGSGE